jgi:hypothetical protein
VHPNKERVAYSYLFFVSRYVFLLIDIQLSFYSLGSLLKPPTAHSNPSTDCPLRLHTLRTCFHAHFWPPRMSSIPTSPLTTPHTPLRPSIHILGPLDVFSYPTLIYILENTCTSHCTQFLFDFQLISFFHFSFFHSIKNVQTCQHVCMQ